MGIQDYPSASHKTRYEESVGRKEAKKSPEEKVVKKVTTGAVKRKKQSVAKKTMDVFIKDDLKTIKEYAIWDVWVPAIKNTLRDSLIGSIEAVFGRSNTTAAQKRNVAYDYTNVKSYRPANAYSGRPQISRERAVYGYDEIILDTRREAEDVVLNLNDIISAYGTASVADYYQLTGATSEYTDNKYGWDEIIEPKILRHRDGGFTINLPRPIVLN